MATSAQFTKLFNNVRVHIPGAVDEMVKQELWNTMDDFFTLSRVWKDEADLPVYADTTVHYTKPNQGRTIFLYSLKKGTRDINATMKVPNTIVLEQAPTTNDTYVRVLDLSCIFEVDASGYPIFPDWVLDKHLLCIQEGLISRLMAQPAKPYTNESLAILRSRKFRDMCAIAKHEAEQGNRRGMQNWVFPPF